MTIRTPMNSLEVLKEDFTKEVSAYLLSKSSDNDVSKLSIVFPHLRNDTYAITQGITTYTRPEIQINLGYKTLFVATLKTVPDCCGMTLLHAIDCSSACGVDVTELTEIAFKYAALAADAFNYEKIMFTHYLPKIIQGAKNAGFTIVDSFANRRTNNVIKIGIASTSEIRKKCEKEEIIEEVLEMV